MPQAMKQVGIREFRQSLAGYLESDVPVAITRHGQTVGYFVPARPVQEERMAALRGAIERLQDFLAGHGITEEEVMRDFRARRRPVASSRPSGSKIPL